MECIVWKEVIFIFTAPIGTWAADKIFPHDKPRQTEDYFRILFAGYIAIFIVASICLLGVLPSTLRISQ